MPDLYRELQQRLDTYSIGFPATETGIEIQILERLFSPDDVKIFLALSQRLEAPDMIAQRIGGDGHAVSLRLEDMAGRGLVFRLKKEGIIKYCAIPFMHGILEYQVKRMDRKLWQMFEEYFSTGFRDAITSNAASFVRTIPVRESLTEQLHIATFDDAARILESRKIIVVTECICRKGKNTIDQGCGKPLEVCFMFDSMAQYYLDHGLGRQITVEQGMEILQACHAAGLVTQPATSQNPSAMCNCCGDCCGILMSLNALDAPAQQVFSNYSAVVDAHGCSGCEACKDRCQMGAIRECDGVVCIDHNRCIGCGLCVSACAAQAINLKPKTGDQYQIPPATSAEQMMVMAQKRGLI